VREQTQSAGWQTCVALPGIKELLAISQHVGDILLSTTIRPAKHLDCEAEMKIRLGGAVAFYYRRPGVAPQPGGSGGGGEL